MVFSEGDIDDHAVMAGESVNVGWRVEIFSKGRSSIFESRPTLGVKYLLL
jgi:hypothetical protein